MLIYDLGGWEQVVQLLVHTDFHFKLFFGVHFVGHADGVVCVPWCLREVVHFNVGVIETCWTP